MTELAARIGRRLPTGPHYPHKTWVRPGLEEEEKHTNGYKTMPTYRRHHSGAPSRDMDWRDHDSEASSSNEDDTHTPTAQTQTSFKSASKALSKSPKIVRNRVKAGERSSDMHTPPSLMQRLGLPDVASDTDGSAAPSAQPSRGDRTSDPTETVDVPSSKSSGADRGASGNIPNISSASGTSEDQSSLLLGQPTGRKTEVGSTEDSGDVIPGLTMSLPRCENAATQQQEEKVTHATGSGSAAINDRSHQVTLISNMRDLLVPLVVKKASLDSRISSAPASKKSDMATKAQSIITDDICEEFIRQAIAAVSDLEKIGKKPTAINPPTLEEKKMPPPTRESSPLPPGLGLMAQSAPSIAAKPAVVTTTGADTGKTVQVSHSLPTGPRALLDQVNAVRSSVDLRDPRAKGPISPKHPSSKGKEREFDSHLSQDVEGYAKPHYSRRRSPYNKDYEHRSVSGRRTSRSLSKSAASRSARRRSPTSGHHEHHRPHSPTDKYSRSRDRKRTRSRSRSPRRDYRDERGRRPYDRRRSPSAYDKPRRASPTRSVSSSMKNRQYKDGEYRHSKSRGHSPPLTTPREFGPIARPPKEAYSPVKREGPPRGWSRSPGERRGDPDPPKVWVDYNSGKRKAYTNIKQEPDSPAQRRRLIYNSSGSFNDPSSKYSHSCRQSDRYLCTHWSHAQLERERHRAASPHPESASAKAYLTRRRELAHDDSGSRPPWNQTGHHSSFAGPSPYAYHDQYARRDAHQTENSTSPTSAFPPHPSAMPPKGPSYQHYGYRAIATDSLATQEGGRRGHAAVSSAGSYSDLNNDSRTAGPKVEETEVSLAWDAPAGPKRVGDPMERDYRRGSGGEHQPQHQQYRSVLRESPMDVDADFKVGTGTSASQAIASRHDHGSLYGDLKTAPYPPANVRPASASLFSGLDHLKAEEEDRKPDIKALEKLAATLKSQQQRTVQNPLTPPTRQPYVIPTPLATPSVNAARNGILAAPEKPPLPTPQSTLEPQDIPAVLERLSKILPLPPVAVPSFTVQTSLPTPVDTESVSGTRSSVMSTRVDSPQSMLSSTVQQSTSAQSGMKEKTRQQDTKSQVGTSSWTSANDISVAGQDDVAEETKSFATTSVSDSAIGGQPTKVVPPLPVRKRPGGAKAPGFVPPLPVRKRPSAASSVSAVVKQESPPPVALAPVPAPAAPSSSLSTYRVPGVWLVQEGMDKMISVNRTFDIDEKFARAWNLIMRSDADAMAADAPNATRRVTVPSLKLHLLCFSTATLAVLEGWKGIPEMLLTLPQSWPKREDFIVVANDDTSLRRVWLGQDLPGPDGKGSAIRLEYNVFSGPNALRIIQLTDLSKHTFVLVAEPDG